MKGSHRGSDHAILNPHHREEWTVKNEIEVVSLVL